MTTKPTKPKGLQPDGGFILDESELYRSRYTDLVEKNKKPEKRGKKPLEKPDRKQ
jgi:hypothetical protein